MPNHAKQPVIHTHTAQCAGCVKEYNLLSFANIIHRLLLFRGGVAGCTCTCSLLHHPVEPKWALKKQQNVTTFWYPLIFLRRGNCPNVLATGSAYCKFHTQLLWHNDNNVKLAGHGSNTRPVSTLLPQMWPYANITNSVFLSIILFLPLFFLFIFHCKWDK